LPHEKSASEGAFFMGQTKLLDALPPVGAAEGCDLLILIFKIKRSQPSAAPTLGRGVI
jgi:hypothetical protein